jgi:membrane protein required for colicin V production
VNFIDIIVLVLLGLGIVRGFMNGVIREVAGLLGAVLGIWAGLRLAFVFAEYYRQHIDINEKLLPFLAFLTAFVLALVAVLLLGRVLDKIVKEASLGIVNKLMGALFGALKWGFITGSILNIVGNSGYLKSTMDGSATYPYITGYTQYVTEYSIGLVPQAKNVFGEMNTYFNPSDSTGVPIDSTAH